MAQVDSEVYARQLLPKNLGYPLWFPEPFDDSAPVEYKERGVSIGDVGIITENGAFDYIFSVCRPTDDPANYLGVPSGFEQIVLGRGDISSHSDWQSPGDFIMTQSVKRRNVSVDISTESNPLIPAAIVAGLQFTSSSNEGAVLALPGGAAQYNLRRRKKFKEYALKHGPSWYEFVNGTLERGVGNGSLYLVTGCDKASSWGVASFSSGSEDGEISLKFKAAQVGAGHASYEWQWETQNAVAVRTGPKRINRERSPPQSQCVFIRGFKVAVRENPLVAALRGSVNLSSVQNLKLEDILSKGASIPFEGGSKSILFGKRTDASRRGGSQDNTNTDIPSDAFEDEVSLKSEPETSEPFHPSTVINKYLLNSMPEALVAVTHDDDWGGIIEENESVFPDNAELLRRIGGRYQIRTRNEGVFLVPVDNVQSVRRTTTLPQQTVPLKERTPNGEHWASPLGFHSTTPQAASRLDKRLVANENRGPSIRGATKGTPSSRRSYPCDVCYSKNLICSLDRPSCRQCLIRGGDCTWGDITKRLSSHFKALLETKLGPSTQGDYAISRHDRKHGTSLLDDDDHSAESDSSELTACDPDILRTLRVEDNDLQLYGPTSIFQFAPDVTEEDTLFPEVNNPYESYVLSASVDGFEDIDYDPDFDWSRYLPQTVPLDRLEHDRILDLLFKFMTSWCLHVVPSLFLRDMYRALSVPRSQVPPRTPHYSPMLHNALLAIATAFSDDPMIRDIKSRRCFANVAKSYIDTDCQTPNIAVLQALSMLGSFHSGEGEQSLGYMYSGMSGRISQALGLNIDSSPWVKANLITHEDMLDRNWAHWTSFAQDVRWSLYVGRELTMSIRPDQNIPFPFIGTELDQAPWCYPPSGNQPQPNNLYKTFEASCRLLRIATQIMDILSTLSNSTIQHNHNVTSVLVSQVDNQLHVWKKGLPPDIDIDLLSSSRLTATPHRLMLHLTFWQLFILLHRPFYTSKSGAVLDINHAQLCNQAADNILKLLYTWRSIYTLRYTPIDIIQVVFSAGTSFLLSAMQASSVRRVFLISRLETCIQYLHETGSSWRCAFPVADILENLQEQQTGTRPYKAAWKTMFDTPDLALWDRALPAGWTEVPDNPQEAEEEEWYPEIEAFDGPAKDRSVY